MAIFDANNNCNLVHFDSYKDKRVTGEVLFGYIHAFSTAFDFAFILQHDLKAMLGKDVPIDMFIDSKSLFDMVTKASYAA